MRTADSAMTVEEWNAAYPSDFPYGGVEIGTALWLISGMPEPIRPSPPPQEYDHPFQGRLTVIQDLRPWFSDENWGEADISQIDRGICTIHTAPIGYAADSWVLDAEGYEALLRHEHAHCNGLVHPRKDATDEWVPIKPRPPSRRITSDTPRHGVAPSGPIPANFPPARGLGGG
jgi:hypothetical protein